MDLGWRWGDDNLQEIFALRGGDMSKNVYIPFFDLQMHFAAIWTP